MNDSIPRVESITPPAAIPGGEIAIRGKGFSVNNNARPRVIFGDTEANLLIAAESYLVARVPEGSSGGSVRVATSHGTSPPVEMQIGVQIAENLHPVANPAVDGEGNIYVTYSGQHGQKVPVSLYKITANYQVKPFATELVNPTGLALDGTGTLYVSCRNDGTIHKVTPDGRSQLWVEGMGIATGIAFDADKNLFVGDRSGTIFKINPDRQIFVFATLEPSISAYHLAFNQAGDLFVSGPTTSSYDRIVRINRQGEVSLFYRGLGRPQGLAFDREGNLYIAASLNGRRGIARINPDGKANPVLSGTGLVGLALLPTRRAVLATNSALFSVDWNIEGLPLPV
jgi:outer membrane protein assembly factor BamB